jgi:competence protein ComEC
MVTRSITPVLCAAIGAAVGFYCLGSLPGAAVLSVMFVSLAALCFLRVLTDLNVFFYHEPPQTFFSKPYTVRERSWLNLFFNSFAFIAGLALGVCAEDAGRNVVSFGIAEEKIIAIEGVLLEDPRIISEGRAMASLSLRKNAGSGGLRTSASGEVTVFFPEESADRLREFGRGAAVFCEGRLRENGGAYTYSADSVHIVKRAPAIERMRTDVRLKLIERFDNPVWGGLALALLVGIRDNLDTNLTLQYRNAGLSYILALSGMHLAVITALIAFLLKRPLGIKAAALAGAFIICLYCFIVGPMPSLNRAAIMYLLGVLAILGALPKESLSVLALSFLIQIMFTPSSGSTISFILSYLAMVGILITGKALSSLFMGKVPDFLLQPLAISLGAFIATSGVCYYIFGSIAPAGIIAGLIIVPATTAFMIGSILYLILDLFSLSFILNLPLALLYKLMENTASVTGNVPALTAARPLEVIVLSLVISLLIAVFEHRRRDALLRLKPFYD